MTYQEELNRVRVECIKAGWTTKQCDTAAHLAENTLLSIGFRSGAQVRSIAMKNGSFVK